MMGTVTLYTQRKKKRMQYKVLKVSLFCQQLSVPKTIILDFVQIMSFLSKVCFIIFYRSQIFKKGNIQ